MDGGAVAEARSEAVEALGDLFRELATSVRLSVVMQLSDTPRSVGELVEALGVNRPLVSQHLRVLRVARLMVVDQRRRERVYRLLDDHVLHIVGDAARHVAEHSRRPGVPGLRVICAGQAAWVQVVQEQSAQVQLLQLSEQCAQLQVAWLQVGQVQSVQSQTAQESLQFAQEQTAHSS